MFERLRRVQPAESKRRDQAHMAKLLGNVGIAGTKLGFRVDREREQE